MSLIYCVEDDENIRELILYALKNAGFEAQGFESGKELDFSVISCSLISCCLERMATKYCPGYGKIQEPWICL
jgi:FixJ family two-component response regulator